MKLSDVIKVEAALDPFGHKLGFFRASFLGYARTGSPIENAHTAREAVHNLVDSAICATRKIIYRRANDDTLFALRQLRMEHFSYDVVHPSGLVESFALRTPDPEMALRRMEEHVVRHNNA